MHSTEGNILLLLQNRKFFKWNIIILRKGSESPTALRSLKW